MFKFSYINIGKMFYKSAMNEYKLIKNGFGFILFGIILFILKELLIGFVSFIFILIGINFLYKAFKLWKSKNQIYIQ